MQYCNCHRKLSVKQAFKYLFEEIVEWIQTPNKDEWSDICYCINRLLGTIVGKEIIYLLPTWLHDAKIRARMREYGCIRSKRHRVTHTLIYYQYVPNKRSSC